MVVTEHHVQQQHPALQSDLAERHHQSETQHYAARHEIRSTPAKASVRVIHEHAHQRVVDGIPQARKDKDRAHDSCTNRQHVGVEEQQVHTRKLHRRRLGKIGQTIAENFAATQSHGRRCGRTHVGDTPVVLKTGLLKITSL